MATATATKTAKKGAAHTSDESRMQKIADSIQSTAEKLRDRVANGVHDSGTAAKVRSVDVSIAVIKLQRSMFDRTFKMLARIQKYSDKLVKRHVQGADWLPNEGKDIVKEWSHMLDEGRVEFEKTVDKSYDLLKEYLERVRKQQASAGKKTGVAKSPTVLKAKGSAKTKVKAKGAGKAKSMLKKKSASGVSANASASAM
jgi:hypothetical protein